jgi:hypothetical protein
MALASRPQSATKRGTAANVGSGGSPSGAAALQAPAPSTPKHLSAGMNAVFGVAESEGSIQAFAGLTLLSQVFFEEGAEVKPMHPANLLPPSMRVGLREPINEPRSRLEKLVPRDVAIHRYSCQTIYKFYCEQYDVKPNSRVLAMLPERVGDFMSVTEISVKGNYVGERGILPLLEVARLCENLRKLNFSGNGLRNSSVEWIVEYVLATPKLCPKISHIDLSDNRISMGAGKILLLMAIQRPSVVEVIVGPSKVSTSAATSPAAPSLGPSEAAGSRLDRCRIDAVTLRRIAEQLALNRQRAEMTTGRVVSFQQA